MCVLEPSKEEKKKRKRGKYKNEKQRKKIPKTHPTKPMGMIYLSRQVPKNVTVDESYINK